MTVSEKADIEPKVDGAAIHREPPPEPYRGIAPFRFIDEPIFFGREYEAEELRRTVLMYRGVLFYGDSGAGKSSLLNARFIPQALDSGFLPNRIRLQPQRGAELVVERISLRDAGQSPFLPSTLAPSDSETPRWVLSIQEFERLVRVAAKRAAEKKTPGRALPKPLLIFDQFEEFVTLFDMASEEKRAEAREVQAAILDLLVRLLEDRALPVKLVFTFREDYLAKIEKLVLRKPDLVEQRVRLVPPELSKSKFVEESDGLRTRNPLRNIIRGPLAIHGPENKPLFPPKFTDLLCDRLEVELRGRSKSGFLNLSEIQIVCRELWHSQQPEQVFELLGVDGLLEKFLSDALARLGTQRDLVIALLTELVTEAKTRNIVLHDQLVARVEKDMKCGKAAVEAALKMLVDETGLVRLELRHNIPFYEIISEFLIPWIFQLKEERRLERERAELFAAEKKRRKIWLGMLIASAVVVLFLGGMWLQARESNILQRKHLAVTRAQRLGDEAQQSMIQTSGSYPAMLAAIDGVASCIREGVYAPPGAVMAMHVAAQRVSLGLDRYHDDRISNEPEKQDFIPVAPSPNGDQLVTVEDKNTPVLWDTWTLKPERMHAVDNGVAAVGFSRDSMTFAVASVSGAISAWSLRDGINKASQLPIGDRTSLAEVLKLQPDQLKTYTTPAQARAWDNYIRVTVLWLIDAAGLVTRRYNPDERPSFPHLRSQDSDATFTDEISDAFAEARKDHLGGAKQSLTKVLKKFRIADSTKPEYLLAQMYITSARIKTLAPATLLEAVEDYKRAQSINPNLGAGRMAEAVEAIHEGDDYAANGLSDQAAERYRFAASVNKSLVDPKLFEPGQIIATKEFTRDVEDKVNQANELAKNGEREKARQFYEEAKRAAPHYLGNLNVDEQLAALSPKGPAPEPWILEGALQKMKQGYDHAEQGDLEGAKALFEETVKLDPRQSSWLNPETEVRKYPPRPSVRPSARPAVSPEIVPPVDPTVSPQ